MPALDARQPLASFQGQGQGTLIEGWHCDGHWGLAVSPHLPPSVLCMGVSQGGRGFCSLFCAADSLVPKEPGCVGLCCRATLIRCEGRGG